MSSATLLSPPCVQSTEQDAVHAVVVDMPKVISLSSASPDTGMSSDVVPRMSGLRQLARRTAGHERPRLV